MVADSCDERDESCAVSSNGSTQPLTAESEDHNRHLSIKVPFILVRVAFSGAFWYEWLLVSRALRASFSGAFVW